MRPDKLSKVICNFDAHCSSPSSFAQRPFVTIESRSLTIPFSIFDNDI